ncbi:MAG: hypothetical protein DRH20_04355 [Deltaproteobacteria bacterium]|nr:MAG: hypothetical protein DRH20_04355 [Deltaproteobacteria bacterium]
MNGSLFTTRIGHRISLPGHFDVPVVLEDVRPLGPDASAGYECRVRLPDGSLEEPVISAAEAASILGADQEVSESAKPVDAVKLRLLVESSRIRLAYAHDRQFAVSLSGIRTLPHQIEKEVALTVRHLNMLSWITAKASTDLPITEEEVLHV